MPKLPWSQMIKWKEMDKIVWTRSSRGTCTEGELERPPGDFQIPIYQQFSLTALLLFRIIPQAINYFTLFCILE